MHYLHHGKQLLYLIYKEGSDPSIQNYRPIYLLEDWIASNSSLLGIISFEQIVFVQERSIKDNAWCILNAFDGTTQKIRESRDYFLSGAKKAFGLALLFCHH